MRKYILFKESAVIDRTERRIAFGYEEMSTTMRLQHRSDITVVKEIYILMDF
jgi:hypothetical protein